MAVSRTVVVGTAGHIDHGKTSLVLRLTGIDTDRLPEEKRRGITIDLGFAHFDLGDARFALVDVPGHERFVHNMVAGATGVDIALLVVAADDAVMPQTAEHVAILDLLGVPVGVVALTKIDLVEPEMAELAAEDVRALLAPTRLAGSAVLPVSNATGAGLEALRAELARLADGVRRTTEEAAFRMPIDRAFTLAGHGTVVTGTTMAGAVAVGDLVELLPAGRTFRVRRLHAHGREETSVAAGRRVGVNLAGLELGDVARGDELATPGSLEPSRRLLVQVRAAPGMALADRRDLRLHLGTREATARLLLAGPPTADGWTPAELRCRTPVFANWGQRFILRQLSPAGTVGGGVVRDPLPAATVRRRDVVGLVAGLAADDPADRLAAILAAMDLADLPVGRAAQRIGLAATGRAAAIDQLSHDGRAVSLPGGAFCHAIRATTLAEAMLSRASAAQARRAPARSLDPAAVVAACRRLASPETLQAVLAKLLADGRLVRHGAGVALPGAVASLTRRQRELLPRLLALVQGGGTTPPTIDQLLEELKENPRDLETVAQVAAEDGLLVAIGAGLHYDPAILDGMLVAAEATLAAPATVAQLRDAWGVTRKHAVPLCEFLDRQGITRRQGELRVPGPKFGRRYAGGEATPG